MKWNTLGDNMVNPLRIKIIGIGGIGSYLAEWITMSCSFHAADSVLYLVDGDTFEPKNKERQNFTELGFKARVVAKELQDQFSNVFLYAVPSWIVAPGMESIVQEGDEDAGVSKISATDFFEDGDIIVLAVDNNACRGDVFKAAALLNDVDVFSGGNGEKKTGDALFGSVYHWRRRNGDDVNGSPLQYHEDEYLHPKDRNPGELSCQERMKLDGGMQTLAANVSVAAIILAKMTMTIFSADEAEIERSIAQGEIYFDWAEGLARNDERPVLEQKREEVKALSLNQV